MKVTKTERLGNGILLVTVPVTFKWRNTGNGPVIINPDSSIVDLRRETILTAVARGVGCSCWMTAAWRAYVPSPPR